VKPPVERSRQVIVVTSPEWNSVKAAARTYERRNTSSKWKAIADEFPVVVGRSGLAADSEMDWGRSGALPALFKKEGDGRAPAGMFPLTFAFGTADAGSKLPFTTLVESTECVDDVDSSFYNKIVDRYKVGNFDWKSSEKMLDVGPQYELGVFVGYNSYPVNRGRGSCIFLHIWKDSGTGTSGCTAMSREDLERVVRWLDPAKNPYLIQLTAAEYDARRRSFGLPKIR
jgi:D-alanyl-D-alanine dipeptidase